MSKQVLVLSAVALLATAAQAAEAATSGVYFRVGDGSARSEESTLGPVSASEIHEYDFGSSAQHASASAAHQTLRARSTVEQDGSQPAFAWITADTDAEYRKDMVVPTGPFGAAGTAISLPLTLSFHGNVLVEGGLFGPGRMLGSVDTSFSFEVQDLDELVCSEGCRPRVIAEFGFRGYASFDTGFGAAGRESVANYYWVARQAGVEIADDSFDYAHNEPGVTGAGNTRYGVGTGPIELDLATRTGHTLRFVSSLDVFAQSTANAAWSNVVGDFSRTFDADLFLPAPGGAIDGETLGVYSPVPAPAAVWGMGSALALLLARGRRRHMSGMRASS